MVAVLVELATPDVSPGFPLAVAPPEVDPAVDDPEVEKIIVQVSKVIDLDRIEDAQRQALAGRLRQAVADEELESTLSSLRDRVGVAVKKGALDVKENRDEPQRPAMPQPRGKF